MKSFKSKKGQAALEFLMTYGWAFLVILIMIGALAYFGVLNPTRFLPERCTFGSEFLCKDYSVTYDDAAGEGDVTIRFTNNAGKTVYFMNTANGTNVTSDGGFGGCTIYEFFPDDNFIPANRITYGLGTAKPVPDGGEVYFRAWQCSNPGGMVAGSKYKLKVDFAWFDATSSETFRHTSSGEIFTNVEEP